MDRPEQQGTPARRARYQAYRPQALEGCHQRLGVSNANEGDAVGVELMQEVPSKLRAYLDEEFGPVEDDSFCVRGRAVVARVAHNQEVAGSSPDPGTNSLQRHGDTRDAYTGS